MAFPFFVTCKTKIRWFAFHSITCKYVLKVFLVSLMWNFFSKRQKHQRWKRTSCVLWCCAAAFPPYTFCTVWGFFYLWRASSLGICLCLCLWRWTSWAKIPQCFLLIQAWTRDQFFLWTNYSWVLASLSCLQPIVIARHTAHTLHCLSMNMKQFLTATNFA